MGINKILSVEVLKGFIACQFKEIGNVMVYHCFLHVGMQSCL